MVRNSGQQKLLPSIWGVTVYPLNFLFAVLNPCSSVKEMSLRPCLSTLPFFLYEPLQWVMGHQVTRLTLSWSEMLKSAQCRLLRLCKFTQKWEKHFPVCWEYTKTFNSIRNIFLGSVHKYLRAEWYLGPDISTNQHDYLDDIVLLCGIKCKPKKPLWCLPYPSKSFSDFLLKVIKQKHFSHQQICHLSKCLCFVLFFSFFVNVCMHFNT